jgi:hypothetical protein
LAPGSGIKSPSLAPAFAEDADREPKENARTTNLTSIVECSYVLIWVLPSRRPALRPNLQSLQGLWLQPRQAHPQWRISSHQGAYNNLRPLLIRQPRPPATEPHLQSIIDCLCCVLLGALIGSMCPTSHTPRTDLTPSAGDVSTDTFIPSPAGTFIASYIGTFKLQLCVLLVLWFCGTWPTSCTEGRLD